MRLSERQRLDQTPSPGVIIIHGVHGPREGLGVTPIEKWPVFRRHDHAAACLQTWSDSGQKWSYAFRSRRGASSSPLVISGRSLQPARCRLGQPAPRDQAFRF